MIQHKSRRSREHVRFYILLSMLLLLLFARYGFSVGVPRIILTGIIALIAFQGNRNEIFAIAMCCIPLHEAVDFFYAVVACAGIYVLKFHKDLRINIAVILVLAMISWELLHCFTSDFALMDFLVSVIPLIFLAVMLCVDVSGIEYDFVVRNLAAVVAALCLILLTNLIVRANYNVIAAIANLRRLGVFAENDILLGGALNPNTLGVICVLATTGLLQLRTLRNEHQLLDVILVIILLVFGALTSSRTFLVCLLLMVLLLILGQQRNPTRKIRLLGAMVLLAVLVVLLLNWIFPELLQYYFGRFQASDITTGRNDLMRDYHNYISEHVEVMSFGVGLQDLAHKMLVQQRVSFNLPHNGIQEVIVVWGVPGLILFTLLCVMLVIQSRKYCKRHILLNYIPLLIVLTKSMAGQLLTSNYTVLSLVYAYLSLCQNFTLKKE